MTNKEKFFAFVAGASLLFSIFAWFYKPTPPTPPTPKQPEEAKMVLTNPTGTIMCPSGGIIVYSYPVKYKDRPVYTTITNTVYRDTASTIKDEEAIIATGIVPSWKGDTNVYTYFNMFNGKSRMIYAQQPYENKPVEKSLIEMINEKSLGVYYGYGTKGRAVVLEGNWSLVRTMAVDWDIKINGLIYNNSFDTILYVGGKYSWQ